jgi:nicotinate-nucleotide adenylyltransferase
VELGLNIREAFNLDKVFYILSARPPHKKNRAMVPAELRWKMLTRALSPFPGLTPCDIEMKRPADSWTVDTIAELNRIYPRYFFYFISGSEGFLKIRTWKNYKKLLNSVSFIVIIRNPAHSEAIEGLLEEEGIRPHYGPGGPGGEKLPCVHIYSYVSDKLAISSTLIRQKIKSSEAVDGFVEEEVKKIMEENELYEK